MIRSLVVAALSSLFFAAGCNKGASPSASPSSGSDSARAALAQPGASAGKSDQDAIREAVQQHLAGNHSINMTAMDMDVTRISINGDQAQADVEFRLKQGGTTMNMSYVLIRHAGGWLVTKGEPGGGQFEHPPVNKNHAMAPPGDPSSGTPAMPDVREFFRNNPAPQSAKH